RVTRYSTVSFLSDYGTGDEFVGVVKSVIRSIEPAVAVIDITHEIPPYDIRAGSLALARAAQYLVPGVVLAVVDPGVGTTRRAVAVEVGNGQSVLVGPDNGLLAAAVGMVGGADRVIELTNADYHLPSPGATFDGRDLFAPVAAHLCAGVDLEEFGDSIEATSLQPGMIPLPFAEGEAVAAQVLWIDRFGNAQLNVGPDDVEHLGDRVRLVFGERSRLARRATSFAELGGDVGLVLDSYGLLAVALDRHPAAVELALATGDEVKIERADGDGRGNGAGPVPVDIGPAPR
ncbi:MAG: SAM-dependent chlorinase/fluorinase, partial [Acidimicrobiales bacterium]